MPSNKINDIEKALRFFSGTTLMQLFSVSESDWNFGTVKFGVKVALVM